ncbi:MAG: D-glycero-beta-D-manno-heptose-7-phosphate kinase [Bdellovibrionales bacterium]
MAKNTIKITLDEIEKKKSNLRESLKSLEGHKILVVGDVGLDEYLSGDIRRISPEAPVPVVEVQSREYRVGLAANVAQNIRSLGGVAVLVGLVGQDEAAKTLSGLLKASGVSELNLICDADRPTTRKVRVMSGQHHVVRVDFEERKFLSEKIENSFIVQISKLITGVDGLILQDYGKGVLSEGLCQKLIEIAHKHNKKVIVDPHRTTPVHFYKGSDLIKPNRDEALILSGLNTDDLHLTEDTIEKVGKAIQDKTSCKNIIITQGKNGVLLFEGSEITHIPTLPRQVFDVTGAGDTYLAAFSLGWLSGLTSVNSAILANFAAGVVVGKIGSVPCSQSELIEAMS